MSIIDDINGIKIEQDRIKAKTDRYVQVLQTSIDVPIKGDIISIEMNTPQHEEEIFTFIPSSKDYRFIVNEKYSIREGNRVDGWLVIAERFLEDGVKETIMYDSNPEI